MSLKVSVMEVITEISSSFCRAYLNLNRTGGGGGGGLPPHSSILNAAPERLKQLNLNLVTFLNYVLVNF